MTGNVDGDDERFGADRSADVFVAALLEAGPEAAEHLLKAAQELLLAAKAVVDAGERALDAHRSSDTSADPAADEHPSPARASGVRRIDLA
jgi:hypothetical protein